MKRIVIGILCLLVLMMSLIWSVPVSAASRQPTASIVAPTTSVGGKTIKVTVTIKPVDPRSAWKVTFPKTTAVSVVTTGKGLVRCDSLKFWGFCGKTKPNQMTFQVTLSRKLGVMPLATVSMGKVLLAQKNILVTAIITPTVTATMVTPTPVTPTQTPTRVPPTVTPTVTATTTPTSTATNMPPTATETATSTVTPTVTPKPTFTKTASPIGMFDWGCPVNYAFRVLDNGTLQVRNMGTRSVPIQNETVTLKSPGWGTLTTFGSAPAMPAGTDWMTIANLPIVPAETYTWVVQGQGSSTCRNSGTNNGPTSTPTATQTLVLPTATPTITSTPTQTATPTSTVAPGGLEWSADVPTTVVYGGRPLTMSITVRNISGMDLPFDMSTKVITNVSNDHNLTYRLTEGIVYDYKNDGSGPVVFWHGTVPTGGVATLYLDTYSGTSLGLFDILVVTDLTADIDVGQIFSVTLVQATGTPYGVLSLSGYSGPLMAGKYAVYEPEFFWPAPGQLVTKAVVSSCPVSDLPAGSYGHLNHTYERYLYHVMIGSMEKPADAVDPYYVTCTLTVSFYFWNHPETPYTATQDFQVLIP